MDALTKEILLRKDPSKNEVVNTIYFGGGTPSLLTIADCRLLLNTLHQNFRVAMDAEITLEANPDDIIIEKLKFQIWFNLVGKVRNWKR